MVHDLDSYVGRILDALDKHALTDRTLVLFTSDNGTTHEASKEEGFHVGGVDAKFFRSTADLRGYKGSVYEGGIRIPLIARLPGRIPAGSVNTTPSYFPDWFPTLCELVGLPQPKGLDGTSLLATMTDANQTLTDRPAMIWVFPEYGGQVAVRWGNNKLLRRGLASKQPDDWELYDLEADRGESRNLADKFPELVAEGIAILKQNTGENPVFPVRVPD
jgi:arylsulfatase A-like enzyme